MAYAITCTEDRVPTHCGTFVYPDGTPPPAAPPPATDEAAEEVIDRTPFGGPLFDNFLGGFPI